MAIFLLLNNSIYAIDYSMPKYDVASILQEDDTTKEEKKNIIKKYFEKRAQKKSDIKEGLIALEEKRLIELLKKKRLKASDTLYQGPAQYQFHYSDLNFYLNNFKDTIYKTELDWSAIQRLETQPFNTLKSGVRSNKFIYGFHPYWMGDAYYNYNFEIYNRIAYYGYVIDPETGNDFSTTGGILAHSWSTSTIQFKANYYNCKVDLCVASYEVDNNIKIFENSRKAAEVRNKLTENIVDLVKKKGNGVCFDIQKVPNQFKANYIDLIQNINTLLNGDSTADKSNKKFQITVLLPRYDIGFPYSMTPDDALLLENHVDRWIFSAESSYGSSFTTGEVTESNMYGFWNFDQIDFELNALPPKVFKNLIMEVPLYYGKSQQTQRDTNLVISKFSDMNNIYPDFSPLFNSAFKEKLTYTKLKGINGVALWCMGYDQNNESIFNSLVDFLKDNKLDTNENFVAALNHMIKQNEVNIIDLYKENQATAKSSPESSSWIKSSIYSLVEELKPEKVMTHHLVVLCLLILLSFVFIGFIISLFFESARSHIFSKENIMNFSTILIVLVMVLIFKKFRVITETEFVFVVGIFTGLVLALVFYRRKKKKDKEPTP
jgi:hypothetical protein